MNSFDYQLFMKPVHITLLSMMLIPAILIADQLTHASESDTDPPFLLLAGDSDPDDFEDDAAFEAYLLELAERFPVDLNRVSYDELMMIPDIRATTARAILDYRADSPFTSTSDLLRVPGIGQRTMESLQPWVIVDSSPTRWSLLSGQVKAEQYFRYQQSFPHADGYRKNGDEQRHYAGHAGRFYHRQSIHGATFSANLTQVKLPGEPLMWPQAFDFTSAHLRLEGIGPIQNMVAGDYALRFGQGLALWSTPTFGKGGAAHNAPYRRSFGITPYRSSGQITYFRGLAGSTKIPLPLQRRYPENELILTMFYSSRPRTSVEISGDTIHPPTSSPYHRTENERDRRHNTREQVHGGNVSLEGRSWKLGLTHYTYRLDRPVLPHPNSPPQRGLDHQIWSTDLSFNTGHIIIFGEYALRTSGSATTDKSPGDRNAWIAGAAGKLSEEADWILALRDYKPGYWSEYGNGFGERAGPPSNQSGWYFGFRVRPSPVISLYSFIDRFSFPEPRGSATRSTQGWESMIRLHYRPTRRMIMQFQVRYKERTGEYETEDAFLRRVRVTDNTYRQSGRIRLNLRFTDSVQLRTQLDRVDAGSRSGSRETGMALSQAIRWQISNSLQLDINQALFDTDDFTSRIYLFETDLTNSMASRMVFGQGRQSAIVIRYRPAGWLLAEVKYGRLYYLDRPAIGTGPDQTSGPARSYAGMQLRLQY